MTTTTRTERKENVNAINPANVMVISIDDLLSEHQAKATTLSGVFKNVFHYAAFCESNFKANMENRGAELIDTTFTSDLSIAEYCEQLHLDGKNTSEAVEDTIKRACAMWRHDEDYIIALLFAVNAKAWEHHAMASDKYASMRAFTKEIHEQYSRYYSDRYYLLLDYVMEELYPGEENEDVRYKIYQAID